MEMLRSMSPNSQLTRPPPAQPQDNADRYSYHERPQAEQRSTRTTTPKISSVSRQTHSKPSAHKMEALSAHNERKARPLSLRAPSKTTFKSATKKKAPHSKKNPAISSTNAHPQRTPKCGFCLVNGYLYCGGQSVLLDTLIEQNQKQKKAKVRRTKPHHGHGTRQRLRH